MAADRRRTLVSTAIRFPAGIGKDVRVTALELSTFDESSLANLTHVCVPDLQLTFLGELDDMFEVFTAIAAKLLMVRIANDQVPTNDGSKCDDQSQT